MVWVLEVKGILEFVCEVMLQRKIDQYYGKQEEKRHQFLSLWTCVYDWSAKQFHWETDNVW